MRKTVGITAVLALGLAACGSSGTSEEDDNAAPAATAPADGPRQAIASLQTAEGESAGSVTASSLPDGVTISINAEGLPPGEHGAHVHMTGACEAPTFESAGGHWNPESRSHGLEAPSGQHAGDMPNLTVGADGTGTLEYQLAGGSFEGLLESDGSAFVIHADADDQVTDPSGNSGDRIACGVFSAG